MKILLPIIKNSLLLAILVFLVTACASGPQVAQDYDTAADFDRYKTYAWLAQTPSKQTPAEPAPKGSPQPLIDARIRTAIEEVLPTRGFTPASEPSQADFFVTYYFSSQTKTDTRSVDAYYGFGVGGRNSSLGFGIGVPINRRSRDYQLGTLMIDIIDAQTRKLVWRGTSAERLDERLTPKQTTQKINKTVQSILARFPPAKEKPAVADKP